MDVKANTEHEWGIGRKEGVVAARPPPTFRETDWLAAVPPPTFRETDWPAVELVSTHVSPTEEWFFQCQAYGMSELSSVVDVDPERCAGVPVLAGTRFTVSQVFAELADGRSINDLADNFDIDFMVFESLLNGMSLIFNRPSVR